jgi:hypothetical protein
MTVTCYVFLKCVCQGHRYCLSLRFFYWILKLCDIFCVFPFIIKVVLDNVLSIIVELWVTLQVKLGNKNTKV